MSEVVDLILQVGAVPSFSYHEERLHPVVYELLNEVPGAQLEVVPKNNLVVSIPGMPGRKTIALSAHLDKIDHYSTGEQKLDVYVSGDKIVGPMDDSAGVGICLAVARAAVKHEFPPLLLLFSEQEECGGAGARNISEFLLRTGRIPSAVITIDTTPLFRGASGLALYAAPWERAGVTPTDDLVQATKKLSEKLQGFAPDIRVTNNGNDYVTYGVELSRAASGPTPSVALEPSIFPYHRQAEEVFVSDVVRLESLLVAYLKSAES